MVVGGILAEEERDEILVEEEEVDDILAEAVDGIPVVGDVFEEVVDDENPGE